MFAMKYLMEKPIKIIWIAGFFLPAINATVFKLLHNSPGFSDHSTALRSERSSEGFSLPLPNSQGGSFKKFHFSFLNIWISESIFLFLASWPSKRKINLFHQNFAVWDKLRY